MIDQPQIPNPQFQIELSLEYLNRGTILIIDDNYSNLEFLGNFLNDSNFNVLVASNGETAIFQAEYSQPDIILLDVIMPGIDGFETCRRLKENEATKNIPVIFMTALSNTEDQVKGFKVGAVDYITKPIQSEELLARVTTHLTLQKLQKQLRKQNLRLQQQMARERLIATMQERIRQSLNLEEILNTTVKEVRHFLQTDRVIIYQFKSNADGIVAVESVGPGWMPILQQTIADPCFAEGHIEYYREGRARATRDIYSDGLEQCYIDLLAQFQVKSNLVVPIHKKEELWGLLIAHQCSRPRQWQQVEINLLQQLVTQVGIAIQQAQLYQDLKVANQKLRRLATLDSLTQLANRRRFNAYLNQEWRRLGQHQCGEEICEKTRSPLSLILCDVDFFKLYNDTYGHLAGDFCLQQVAQAIQAAVNRPGALVARYGGEELAVILPNTRSEDAFYIAELIRKRVKALEVTHAKSPIAKYVTLSLGVCSTVPGNESSPQKLIDAADRALYRAKKEGRDRTYLIRREDPYYSDAGNWI